MARNDEEAHAATTPASSPGSASRIGLQPAIVDPSRYARRRELARGGIGRITEAWDHRLGRLVALKELLEDRGDQRRRFLREAEITARLQHPHIIPVHDVGYWPDGAPFYAMRLITGATLRHVTAGCVGLRERLAYLPNVIAVAEAVAYAHSQGIIHRDIKPSNILIGPFGETVVVDWGLAKLLDDETAGAAEASGAAGPDDGEPDFTVAGAVMGTPAFMSPEQARGDPVDGQTDVYSLGAILYQLLGGVAPYEGASSEDILAKVVSETPVALHVRAPDAPRELLTIVAKAMQRDRTERYAGAREVVADLRRFQTGQLVAAHRYSGLGLLWRWVRRHRAPVAVAAVSLAILVYVVIVSFGRIAAERDVARAERERAVARSTELTLLQAGAALPRDPTEAIAWIESLPPAAREWSAARLLALDARARGIARHAWRKHGAPIEQLAVAPDGKTIVSGSFDRTARLWRLDPDGVVAELRGHTYFVSAVSFSPDGATVATASADGTVRLWNRLGGAERVLGGDQGPILSLAFSRDGGTLVTGGKDHRVRLWELATGRRTTLEGHGGPVRVLKVSPRDGLIASAGGDASVRLWRASGASLAVLDLHGNEGSDLAFSPDGTLLAAATSHDLLLVWDVATRTEVASLRQRGRVLSTEFSADGRLLAAGGDDGVHAWTTAGFTPRGLADAGGPVNQVRFSPDARQLASAGSDGAVRVWATTGEGTPVVLVGHHGEALCVAFSGDSTTVLSGGTDGVLRVWRPAPGLRVLNDQGGAAQALAFSPDGSRLVAGLGDGQTLLVRLADGERVTLPRAEGAVNDVQFSADGRDVAACAEDGVARVTRIEDGRSLSLPLGTPCLRVAFSPSGRLLVTGGKKGGVAVWRVAGAGDPEVRLGGDDFAGVAFSPDERSLATTGFAKSVRIVDLASGAMKLEATHDSQALDVAFARDGRTVASAWVDGRVRLLDLDTGAERTFTGHATFVTKLRFSPDGANLASMGADNNIWLWPVAARSWREALRAPRALRGHTQRLENIAFVRGGSHLVSTGMDDTVRLWDLASGSSYAIASLRGAHGLAVAPDGVTIAAGGEDGRILLWVDDLPTDPRELRDRLASMTDLTIDQLAPVDR